MCETRAVHPFIHKAKKRKTNDFSPNILEVSGLVLPRGDVLL